MRRIQEAAAAEKHFRWTIHGDEWCDDVMMQDAMIDDALPKCWAVSKIRWSATTRYLDFSRSDRE